MLFFAKFLREKIHFIHIGVILCIFAFIYIHFLTQATHHFPEYRQGAYYNWLADQFLQNRLGMPVALDHYEVGGDRVVYNGQIYLTWGPFPAIVHAVAKVVTGHALFGSVLVYLTALANIAIFWLLLATLARLFYGRVSYPVLYGLTFAYGAGPMMYMMGRAFIYEESIVIASTAILASLWCACKIATCRSERSKLCVVLIAGILFGSAILTRFPSVVYLPLVLGCILLFNSMNKASRGRPWRPIAIFLACVGIGLGLQAWYNWARFDNVSEFGMRHQRVSNTDELARIEKKQTFSWRYIPYNISSYLFSPIYFDEHGNIITKTNPNIVGPYPKLIAIENTVSIFYASPILLLAAFTFIYPLFFASNQRLGWLVIILHTAGLGVVVASSFSFMSSVIRYTQDFLLIFYLLTAISLMSLLGRFSNSLIGSLIIAICLATTIYAFTVGSYFTCVRFMDSIDNCLQFHRSRESFKMHS